MATWQIKTLALKSYFFTSSAVGIYCEYFSLLMKQFGFKADQIGLTTLLGLPPLLIPMCMWFGEKFRARKTLAFLGTLGAVVCCVLPLFPLIIPALQPTCYTVSRSIMKDSTEIEQAIFRDRTVRRKNITNTKILSSTKILSYLTSTESLSTLPVLSTRFSNPHTRYSP